MPSSQTKPDAPASSREIAVCPAPSLGHNPPHMLRASAVFPGRSLHHRATGSIAIRLGTNLRVTGLEANINHWSIETGLHARLDASRHDDRCRLRRRKAIWNHGMFKRWANSLFMHWRIRQTNARHLTTTDFIAHFAEDQARRAVRAITSAHFPS